MIWRKPIVLGDYNLPFTWEELVFRFLLPVLLFFLSAWTLGFLARNILTRHVKNEEKLERALLWARRLQRLLPFVGVILSLGSLLGAQVYQAFGNFFRILNTPFFTSGNTAISVVTLLLLVPVSITASWTGRAVKKTLDLKAFRRFGMDAEKAFTVGRLVRYSAMGLAFLFGLSVIGIDLSAIGVLFGVLGLGIGFGLQSLVADFFAGIALVSMGLVKEGDRIRVAEIEGIIQRIRLMNTELNTFENETLFIPNSVLTGGTIQNFSYKDRRVVVVNSVEVAYNANVEQAMEILKEVGQANPWFQRSSEVIVRVKSFGESGILLQLRTWITDLQHQADAESLNNLEIWKRFGMAGIEIPFPQRVLHVVPADSSFSQVANDHLPQPSTDALKSSSE